MECGKKIAALRKLRNMTQEELGKVLSVTYQAVSKWERGESLPDFEMMARIAKYFNVPLSYFTDDDDVQKDVQKSETATTVAAVAPVTAEKVGICTECGKMISEDEVAQTSPKLICKSCAERFKAQAETERSLQEVRARVKKQQEIENQRGHGVNPSMFISIVLAVACYIGLAIFCGTVSSDDLGPAGAVLFLIPLAVFGAVQAFASFISEIRNDFDDGPEGYTRNISLIVAGIFAIINLVCFLVLYIITKDIIIMIFLVMSVILSFTFVSQFMWGGIIRTIFTAGGFTFKLPGFIITLDLDSILWMIIAKFFLGLLSILVFVVTTLIVTFVAIFASVFTFIPSVITKSVKDKRVEK